MFLSRCVHRETIELFADLGVALSGTHRRGCAGLVTELRLLKSCLQDHLQHMRRRSVWAKKPLTFREQVSVHRHHYKRVLWFADLSKRKKVTALSPIHHTAKVHGDIPESSATRSAMQVAR